MTTEHSALTHLAETLREEVERLTEETAPEWVDEQLDIVLQHEVSARAGTTSLRGVLALCVYGGPTATVAWNAHQDFVTIEACWSRDTVTLTADAPALIEQFQLVADSHLA